MTAQGHMGQLKARSWNLEAKLQYDTPQPNPTGSCGVYATTSIYDDEDVDIFYEELGKALDEDKSKYNVVMSDFNPKIGQKDKHSDTQSMGPFGTGEKNVRGERLIKFAEERNLIIANTLFQKPEKRMWTWESPDGTTRNQIDFTMTSERNMSKDCGVITKIDIGSDHRMVRARIVINSRLERLRRIKKKETNKDKHRNTGDA
ncbi:endonuclease-reverse transcriptase [Plakobranchus ocellatus]|uniref:Endonuclease-reverse transcriptase n=1 Tax=Plakobranchus ocellatus TaxID=259542 RepID=A0AAV3XVX0_9GAST|nr:endonuclease-reverse transcriptase [Plakobranchus ocellatus]